jgi:hypothetical protein
LFAPHGYEGDDQNTALIAQTISEVLVRMRSSTMDLKEMILWMS